MKILPPSQFQRMPWKNGGGETLEVAIWPQNADANSFDWRISLASVATDGPFSLFPGVDRKLSVIEGDGIVLTGDGIDVALNASSAPFAFPGDVAVSSRLMNGAIRDLNVMSRRGKIVSTVHRLNAGQTLKIKPEAETLFIYGGEGGALANCSLGSFHVPASHFAQYAGIASLELSVDAAPAYLILLADITT